MNEKKSLAYTSRLIQYEFLGFSILTLGISYYLQLYKFDPPFYFAVVVSGVLSLTQFIYLLTKPYKRINYDDEGVYINSSRKNIIFIPYSNIQKVTQETKNYRYRYLSIYTVRIVTKYKIYPVRYISKVNIVEAMLYRLVEEWKNKNI